MSDPKHLIVPEEDTYFTIAAILSVIAWLLVILSCWGFLFALVAGLSLWLTHGLLVARLRSESVLVTPQQLPALYQSFQEVCATLQVAEIPELYVLQHGGIINAFATRHAGRNFVVIYSSFLDVYAPDSSAIKFILGHELGHLQRHHHFRRMLILPALIFPMIMEAYSRACESTCDRYGASATSDQSGAAGALVLLSGGRISATQGQPTLFAGQYRQHRGFFVSWHELISTYPSLSRRVSQVAAFYQGIPFQAESRNTLAYVFAFLFTFRTLILLYFLVIFLDILILLGSKHPGAAGDPSNNLFLPSTPTPTPATQPSGT